MQPFNLERFKAGEPAYQKDTLKEFFYFGDRPGGRIAVKYLNHDVWVCYSTTIQILNDVYYMKEKELTWEDVYDMWHKDECPNYDGWLKENFEAPKPKKNNMAQQTAVEFLFEQVTNLDWKNLTGEKKTEIFEQAKQIEKEQIIKAYIVSDDNPIDTDLYRTLQNNDAEQYYNETFNK